MISKKTMDEYAELIRRYRPSDEEVIEAIEKIVKNHALWVWVVTGPSDANGRFALLYGANDYSRGVVYNEETNQCVCPICQFSREGTKP